MIHLRVQFVWSSNNDLLIRTDAGIRRKYSRIVAKRSIFRNCPELVRLDPSIYLFVVSSFPGFFLSTENSTVPPIRVVVMW